MNFIFSIFTALADIKAIGDYILQFSAMITVWYCQRQNSETLSQIADAAALAARAETDEERYKAADAWHVALSRSRVSS